MKAIRNMRELQLQKQNLKYQEKLHEREIAGITADIVDNFTERLRYVAFDWGSRLVFNLIQSRKKKKRANKG